MNINALTIVVILAFAFAAVANGQVPGTSSALNTSTEIRVTDARVDQIIERANDHFTKGKLNLTGGKREQARDEFDKGLDEILTSGLDVRASKHLETFYLEMVEKIYREEVPLIHSASQRDAKATSQDQIGFRQQTSESSSVELLSKLALADKAQLKAEQQPCTLGIDKAPAIRGIRLGMTVSEVRAIHPTISKSNTSDTADVSMRYFAASSKPDKNLKGVSSLFLDFFRGRLRWITVFYDPDNVQEIEPILTVLSLPKEAGSRVTCQGFAANIGQIYSPVEWEVSLWDTAAEEKMAALKVASEIKKDNAQCERSPVIRGIRLGMTIAQFKTLYPRARIIKNRTEVGEIVFLTFARDDARLKGVSNLLTYFLDGKAYFLSVDYTSQIEWKSLDQFVEQFSKTTGLPAKWDGVVSERTLRCNDFTVQAQWSADHPRVMVADRSEVLKLTKREERSKSPANFRP